jgi:hypothetical protein
MKPRQIASLIRSRAVVITALAAAVLLAGCSLANLLAPPPAAPIYGVLYGEVTAPAGRSHVTIQGRVYSDSLDAVAYSSTTGYLGGFPSILPDSSNLSMTNLFYVGEVPSPTTQVVWIDVVAEGQANTGVVFSPDTAWAVRMRLDSLGGTLGRDSININFNLP